MKTSTSEMNLNPGYFSHTRNKPPRKAESFHSKMPTQAYQNRFHNLENGFVTTSEAIAPFNHNRYHTPPIARSCTPDGRVTQRGEEAYRMDKIHRPMQDQRRLSMQMSDTRRPSVHAIELTEGHLTIEMLRKKIRKEQMEIEDLNRTIQVQIACIQTLNLENYQARRLLEQETEENSRLRSNLYITKRELETLNSRQLVSTRVAQLENWK